MPDRHIDRWRLDAQPADEAFADPALFAEVEQSAGRDLLEDRERGVRRNGQFEYDAVTPAVFGHVRDALGDGIDGRANLLLLAVQHDAAAVGGGQSEEDAGQFGSPGTDQPCQAQNLAGPDAQVDSANAAGCATEVVGFQHDVAEFRL